MWNEKRIEHALETKEYLRGTHWQWKAFQPTFPADHSFCVFCWSRVSTFDEDMHEAYFEAQTESYCCNDCFELFSEKLSLTTDELTWEDVFDYS